jgi:hypothetical protein
VKVFQGVGYQEFLKALRLRFEKVVVRKPAASRDESAEQYLLARGFRSISLDSRESARTLIIVDSIHAPDSQGLFFLEDRS